MTKNLVCIACPRGCRLTVCFEHTADNSPSAHSIEVSGNGCPKGLAYGRQEIIRPMRTLTTTVPCTIGGINGTHMRLPVKTHTEIPLKDMPATVQKIHELRITKPVHRGDIIAVLKGEDNNDIPLIACASTERIL